MGKAAQQRSSGRAPSAHYSLDQMSLMTSSHANFVYCMQKLLLIPNEAACENCGSECAMTWRPPNVNKNGTTRAGVLLWTCTRKPRCNQSTGFPCSRTILGGTLFFKKKKFTERFMQYACLRLHGMPQQECRNFLGVSKDTGANMTKVLQEALKRMNTRINSKVS
jgi:hypothetical protein